MATKSAISVGVLPTSGTVDFTVSGFGTVDAAIVIASNANSDTNPFNNLAFSVGFWDGINSVQHCNSGFSQDNVGTTVADRWHETDKILRIATVQTATCSAITDGIRLTLGSSSATPRYVTCIFIGGTTDVHLAEVSAGNDTNPIDVTAPGFKPSIVFFGTMGAGSGVTTAAHNTLSFGVAHNSSTDVVSQGAVYISSEDAVTTSDTESYITDSYCIGQVFNGSILWQLSASSFDASGFTLTPTAAALNRVVSYLAIQLSDADDAWVDLISAATSTGNAAQTGVGFEPGVVGLLSTAATSANTVTSGVSLTYGAADGSSQRSIAVHDEDAQGTTDAANEANTTNALLLLFGGGTTDAVASLSSMDSDGFTLNYSDAAASANPILAFAINDVAASGTITLTDLTNNKIYQRNVGSNNASITVSGTYTGTPTAIEARIVQAGTSTEVVTWTTIDASPTGGTFSGAITVPADDVLYNVDVRFSNDTLVVNEGSNVWGVGMLVGVIGQSNASNWFDVGTDEVANDALKVYAGSWADLSTTGNGAIAFGNALITEFGVAVGLLDYGISASALRSEADSGSGYWLDATPGAPYPLFDAAVTAVGGSLEGVVWAQGERDARSGVVTEAEYETSFTTLITSLRSDITNASSATNLPIFIQMLGRDTTGNDADTYGIRKAQYDVAAAVADVYIACHTVDLPLTDTVHFTAAGYSQAGERVALAFADVLSNDTYHLGPVISSASQVNTTTIDVTLTHDGGSDFTPTSAITGFEVSEDSFSTTKTISAAVRQDANTIRLTVATLTGPWELRYQYGANPTITGAVVDNTTLSLPLGPTFSLLSGGGATAVPLFHGYYSKMRLK